MLPGLYRPKAPFEEGNAAKFVLPMAPSDEGAVERKGD